MFEYEESPPPLHHSPASSDQSHFTSRDTTPLTPVLPLAGAKKSERDKDLALLRFKRPAEASIRISKPGQDSTLLKPDYDDSHFPLFGASPSEGGMANAVPPTGTRQTSTSPRGNQPSTLTSALRSESSSNNRNMNAFAVDQSRAMPAMPHESSSDFARFEVGARPIAFKGKGNGGNDRGRRESIAQSLNTGMSWGGVSVGSWIRDDMMMAGTSPFAFQSPSYHSSSYLPKLEANFMKDFSCCGLILPSLHDLLQHYEEAHAQKDPVQQESAQPQLPDSRAALATTTANQIQQEAQQRNDQNQLHPTPIRGFGNQGPPSMSQRPGFSSTLQTIPDMDTVEDMEMDDFDDGADETTPPSNLFATNQNATSPQTQFSLMQQPQIPQLNTTMMQGHQTYRQSTPSTPVVGGRNAAFQGNSGTSTLMSNPMQQQFQDLHNPYRATPDSSAPGTPGELDENLIGSMDDMSMANNPLFNGVNNGFGNFSFGMNNDMIDLCIDEPAKRLFQQGGNPGQGSNHQRLGSGQYGANSDIARTIRERQVAAGLPDTTTNIMPHEEPKPFRCPVIGCEKAYKNQNGLKYHKSHGHNNQRLHENGDGTFSIVNPDTHAPYPGTQGMEKEKPYKCDVCQKRYKNLNGLKYHKTHSPPCNPELQVNNGSRSPSVNLAGMMPGHGMGALGVGLSGDHSMM